MARGKPLTSQEKCMIVKAHTYFTKEENAGRSGDNPGTKFDEPHATKRSGQSKYSSPDLRGIIREFVIAENEATRPITAQLIANHVAKIMNKKKTIPNNVAFWATYLQKKMTNRDQNNNPVRPEVFLDESYVNVNHVANKTWSTEDKVRKSKSGKGPRIVMVAAGIVTCAAHTQDGSTTRSQDEIDGPFIKESIEDWNAASKKRKGDDSSDYHGNFDSEMFAKWFTNLCTTLRKDYGPCNIHMDGTSYHKRLTNHTPNKKWLKVISKPGS
ncbi:hypothetical protein PF010_g17020 [Phytophthora fragariae]|uniref:Tc1-like transposase DDE domain-containing protein n=1 Tax=Phytophthora fragariae TaxID=53985 RepID=A0A6A3Y5Y0_9STRA|nr:hypothetical protein PF010_g17020 [Phytophthora fragariae]KAE9212663.1 hypothetical protein PF002_g18186 [Phytophthora fragariae]